MEMEWSKHSVLLIIDLLRSRCSLEMEWSKQRTLRMEERKPRALAASSSRHVNARGYGTGVARASSRGGQAVAGTVRSSARGVAWGPQTRARRWRRPTSGGVAAVSSVWRAEWRGRRGRGIGEERKEEDGTCIYMPRPFTPGAIPHRE